ncbi:MAG: hypothetical protein HY054_10735 [Proteobacteria bacterium]|nr:hypothetical protein [Pseudomonadota bacterium]
MIAQVSVRRTVGDALAFLRARWRFVLPLAAAAGAAQTLALLAFGPNLAWLVILAVVSATAFAALIRTALRGPADVRSNVVGDAARVAGAVAIVGVIVAIISIVLLYVAMSIIIAPYADEIRAAGQNQAALQALMQHAISAQPGTLFWAMIAWALIAFFLTSYFYLAAPASVDSRRVIVFQSWQWTNRHILRVAGARILLLLPALVLTNALQTVVGLGLGFTTDDLVALSNQARANPSLFAVFYGVALFFQIAVYAALEAGLSTALYRALKPTDGAVPST